MCVQLRISDVLLLLLLLLLQLQSNHDFKAARCEPTFTYRCYSQLVVFTATAAV